MYRAPLLAATPSSARTLTSLGLSAEGLYDQVFRALGDLAHRRDQSGQPLRMQDIRAEDLADGEIICAYTLEADGGGLIFPSTILERRPTPNFLGNSVATNRGEIALLHPMAGFGIWLNSTATLVWKDCDGCRTVGQIVDHLVSAFPDVERARLEQDLVATLAVLKVLDLLSWESWHERPVGCSSFPTTWSECH